MKNEFLQMMNKLLEQEYDSYIQTLSQPVYRGFRVNTKKVNSEDFFKWFNIPCHASPFAKNAYILDSEDTYGNSLAHALGFMYMQEPSAASAVEVLNPEENDWVLDLCAAPGGKSSQIVERLNSSGLLISNEIEAKRAQILVSNFERLGISNAIITNSTPDKICKTLEGCMDKVLVDAPCSGEGMFKKESQALVDWSPQHVKSCAIRQRQILDFAYVALKENGILVYSTCTYSSEENEETIIEFIKKHPDMELMKIDVPWGRMGLSLDSQIDTTFCRRIFPMDDGEGHFIAKLRKKGPTISKRLQVMTSKKIPDAVYQFMNHEGIDTNINLYMNNNRIYAGKHPFYDLKDNYVLRNQVLIGEVNNERFEPHHHLYTSTLFTSAIKNEIICTEEEVESFRKGNTICKEYQKGYVGIKIHDNFIGFGKSDGSIIKNKIPKGLRIR